MSKNKKIVSIMLALAFIATSGVYTYVKADETSKNINGSIKATFTFDEATKEKARAWYESNISTQKDLLEKEVKKEDNSKEAKEKIIKAQDGLSKIKGSDIIKDDKDGKGKMEVKFPYIEIKIGNEVALTNENAEFTIPALSPGEYTMTLSYEGRAFREDKIKIKKNEKRLDINFNLDGESSIGNAIKRMSAAKEQDGQVTAMAVNTDYPYTAPGDVVPGSTGRGTMVVAADYNIVRCNKADKSLADSANFPWNNSDCAIAIANGTLYEVAPILYPFYFRSYNCFLEAATNMDNWNNIYCNGTNKNGHYNCSWFFGIGHTEQLHTH